MKSINFDNPYLLLIAVPLLVLLLTPFFIAIRKENCSKKVITSLVLHLLITVCVAFGAAGMNIKTVATETQVYVLADVSHSASKNLKQVDDYVRGVEDALPMNSKLGVVVFGRDYEMKTPLGKKFSTVSGSRVDDSATDIAGVLKYAGELFDEKAIKRIVLITDGKQTDGQTTENIISAVEGLHSAGVQLDAIYLDSNLKETQKEAQITGVDYTKNTYLGHEATASVLVQSSFETDALITLKKSTNGAEYQQEAIHAQKLSKGFNVVEFNLATDEEGVFDYRMELSVEGDEVADNNVYDFTQTVEGRLRVVAITSIFDDVVALEDYYAEGSDLDVYVRRKEEKYDSMGQLVPMTVTYEVAIQTEDDKRLVRIKTKDAKDGEKVKSLFADADVTVEAGEVIIPYTVEMLCVYDEIVLSDFDVRTMENDIVFVQNLETAVSVFGKSLLVAGDLQLHGQNEEKATDGENGENDEGAEEADDAPLVALQKMLPINYRPGEQDPKLYGIVLDASRSMEKLWHFQMAKLAAIQLVNLLGEDDYVTVVAFSGDVTFTQMPKRVGSSRAEIVQSIEALDVRQGTYLGAALKKTLEFMQDSSFYEQQVMLITDGMSHTAEADDPETVVRDMRASSIVMSVINTGSGEGEAKLKNLATLGGGSYYYAETEEDLSSLVLEEIAEEVNDTVIEKDTQVHIKRYTDDVLEGLVSLPNVKGFLTTTQKASATPVLTVKYQKESGGWVETPLYTYWDYGEGKVAAFTSKLSGAWTQEWKGAEGEAFMGNVLKENTPEEKNDQPFRVKLTQSEAKTLVEVSSYQLSPATEVVATLTLPSGEKLEAQNLIFDKSRFYHEFKTDALGKYTLDIAYTRNGVTYESTTVFHLCYNAEYDEFTAYDPSLLHKIIRHRGNVSEDGSLDLSNDKEDVEMHAQYLVAPLMIAAVVMFIVDVIVRKLRWVDIVGLFKKSKAGGKRA